MTNDKQRERLVELLRESEAKVQETLKTKYQLDFTEWLQIYADYLLANGVIVPPCGFKKGDRVFVVDRRLKVWWKGEVTSVGYVDEDNVQIGVMYDDCEVAICEADDVFLTKEEAEAKLKEGVQG